MLKIFLCGCGKAKSKGTVDPSAAPSSSPGRSLSPHFEGNGNGNDKGKGSGKVVPLSIPLPPSSPVPSSTTAPSVPSPSPSPSPFSPLLLPNTISSDLPVSSSPSPPPSHRLNITVLTDSINYNNFTTNTTNNNTTRDSLITQSNDPYNDQYQYLLSSSSLSSSPSPSHSMPQNQSTLPIASSSSSTSSPHLLPVAPSSSSTSSSSLPSSSPASPPSASATLSPLNDYRQKRNSHVRRASTEVVTSPKQHHNNPHPHALSSTDISNPFSPNTDGHHNYPYYAHVGDENLSNESNLASLKLEKSRQYLSSLSPPPQHHFDGNQFSHSRTQTLPITLQRENDKNTSIQLSNSHQNYVHHSLSPPSPMNSRGQISLPSTSPHSQKVSPYRRWLDSRRTASHEKSTSLSHSKSKSKSKAKMDLFPTETDGSELGRRRSTVGLSILRIDSERAILSLPSSPVSPHSPLYTQSDPNSPLPFPSTGNGTGSGSNKYINSPPHPAVSPRYNPHLSHIPSPHYSYGIPQSTPTPSSLSPNPHFFPLPSPSSNSRQVQLQLQLLANTNSYNYSQNTNNNNYVLQNINNNNPHGSGSISGNGQLPPLRIPSLSTPRSTVTPSNGHSSLPSPHISMSRTPSLPPFNYNNPNVSLPSSVVNTARQSMFPLSSTSTLNHNDMVSMGVMNTPPFPPHRSPSMSNRMKNSSFVMTQRYVEEDDDEDEENIPKTIE